MNNIVNYNEIRRMAKVIKKKRHILGSLHIKDNTAYFTDTMYLVVISNYHSPNMTIDMDEYRIPAGEYPNLSGILNKSFEKQPFEKTIYNDEVVYSLLPVGTWYIDNQIIKQLEKIVAIKNYAFNIDNITVKGSTAKYVVNDYLTIYFVMKREK